MANNFPVVPSMGLAQLAYSVDIAGVGGGATNFPPGQLHLITYTFETAVDVNGLMQFDYTIIDQDAHETQMRTMLNGLSNTMAGNLGVTIGTVQAALKVSRTWTFVPSDTTAANQVEYQFSDRMTYP